MMKLGTINSGYLVVKLNRGDWTTGRLVHRLVAEAFIGLGPSKQEVNHKDLNKHNNCVGNLEWVTRSDNLFHRALAGVGRGENNGSTVLSVKQVQEIRKRHASGEGYKRISRELGLNWGTVRNVAARRTWKWLEDPNSGTRGGGALSVTSKPA
jgi:hypothetical protein